MVNSNGKQDNPAKKLMVYRKTFNTGYEQKNLSLSKFKQKLYLLIRFHEI